MNYTPSNIIFQWHITERCNLRCLHCYQESYVNNELRFDELINILEQIKYLLKYWKGITFPFKAHITLTGGEPFVRKDFIKFLRIIASNKKLFSFAILSNGSLIDQPLAHLIGTFAPSFVQVSIDGVENTHDMIRGQGEFRRAVVGIKNLVKARVRTFISFTANNCNIMDFPSVVRLARKLGVSRVWSDRLILIGKGSKLGQNILSPHETKSFFKIMNIERAKGISNWFYRTDVSMHRALQFLIAGGRPYYCTAGDSLVTIQPNGDLYPCRRMPIRVGNLLEAHLQELYYDSEILLKLRNREIISEGCQDCFYNKLCRGGLKCLSYSIFGNPFIADPGCWLSSSKDKTVESDINSGLRIV